jgi:hypothetical protein
MDLVVSSTESAHAWLMVRAVSAILGNFVRQLKDQLGDQRGGGSEWEPIKILLKGRTRPMPQIHNQGFPHEFAKDA